MEERSIKEWRTIFEEDIKRQGREPSYYPIEPSCDKNPRTEIIECEGLAMISKEDERKRLLLREEIEETRKNVYLYMEFEYNKYLDRWKVKAIYIPRNFEYAYK